MLSVRACVRARQRGISFLVPRSEEIALQMKLIHFLHITVTRKVREWRLWYFHVLIHSDKVWDLKAFCPSLYRELKGTAEEISAGA